MYRTWLDQLLDTIGWSMFCTGALLVLWYAALLLAEPVSLWLAWLGVGLAVFAGGVCFAVLRGQWIIVR